MKNVCYFNNVKFWGGGEKLHLEYALEFKKKNYNVFVICKTDSPLYTKASSNGLDIFGISVNNLSFLNPLKLIKLVWFYREKKIDTVIFSGSSDLKLGGIAAKLAGVENIVYLRGLAVPVKYGKLNHLIFKNILTHIVANSEETKRSILQNLSKVIDESKVKTIYHGIEIDSPSTSHELDPVITNAKGIILGSAGRLTRQKGQHHLIEIAKILKKNKLEFTLFIAGTGELEGELIKLISENKLENEVRLLGFVNNMDRFMNSIDVFLLTSIWEGFGYVLVEAMHRSKPVIAFDMTSNPEIVTNNETGYLVKYPDVNEFSERIIQLANDVNLRTKLGDKGRQSVVHRFDLIDRIDEFEHYLQNTTKTK
jgi:glycosyltransferase involved in cell wall biosynthesis